jgi:hypothetical protein
MSSNPPENTFVLTGMPRSGTTYLAAVLFDPPGVVTMSESGGEWKQFYREHGPSERVFNLFDEHRRRIERGEPVMTFAGTEGFRGAGRIDTWNQKKTAQKVEVTEGFHLGLKNPEVFLDLLRVFVNAGVKCIVTVRHPVRVINSWVKRVRRLTESGQPIDGTFANGRSVTFESHAHDAVARRIELFNHFARQSLEYRHTPNILLIRHEDWCLDQLSKVCDFLGIADPARLRPPVIPPDSVELPADECARICRECAIAGEFGYPKNGSALAEPDAAPAAVPT